MSVETQVSSAVYRVKFDLPDSSVTASELVSLMQGLSALVGYLSITEYDLLIQDPDLERANNSVTFTKEIEDGARVRDALTARGADVTQLHKISYNSPLVVVLSFAISSTGATVVALGHGMLALTEHWARTRERLARSDSNTAEFRLREAAYNLLRVRLEGQVADKDLVLQRDRLLSALYARAAEGLTHIETVDELDR